MPTFLYTAREGQQPSQPGQIEAADAQAARAELERRGLTVLELKAATVAPGPFLTNDEALELLKQIGEIVKAGLPLAAGLRAIGAEMPSGKYARAIDVLARDLENGAPLDAALTESAAWMPEHLRAMLAAGARAGRLGEVLEESLAIEQFKADTKRRIRAVVAYPLLIVAALLAWSLFVLLMLLPPMRQIYEDFGPLPQLTQFVLMLGGSIQWLLLGLSGIVISVILCFKLSARFGLASWVFARLPVAGPLWRYPGVISFCHLLAALLDQSIPLPAALQLTADGLADGELRAASLRAAREAGQGKALAQCVATSAFPHTLRPIVHWGEQVSAPSESLRSAAELYRKALDLRIELLSVAIPPLTFAVVALTAGILVGALLSPLFSLVTDLP
ncbi:MAG TPA: type II secretion system F family protein [Pirellulales bacterium]|nr:type II secretion system F family protein [Pirellulales bacterium]